eukprot:6044068-Amphidinium_carterae.1
MHATLGSCASGHACLDHCSKEQSYVLITGIERRPELNGQVPRDGSRQNTCAYPDKCCQGDDELATTNVDRNDSLGRSKFNISAYRRFCLGTNQGAMMACSGQRGHTSAHSGKPSVNGCERFEDQLHIEGIDMIWEATSSRGVDLVMPAFTQHRSTCKLAQL